MACKILLRGAERSVMAEIAEVDKGQWFDV
jgi:hypothetical protein